MASHETDAATGGSGLYSMVGTIEATRTSAAYRAGLVVVAAAMLLLPLLYVTLIALVGYGVWWHLTANADILSGRTNMQWRLIAYVTPAVIGTVVMFFMIKPLLARPARPGEPRALTADEEPVLFDFVRQICRQVGAPLPARVQVDCQVNASASLLRGVLSRDLTLTIGLPLVAGLSVRQLGGVLAHEFGHFAQGGGMRFTSVIRWINGWFARVVYERDRWDESLDEWSSEGDGRLRLVASLARGAVWVSRRILSGLMWAGHAISCFLLRQMEYDADSYEVKLAGDETFARTSTRLRELGLATQMSHHELRDTLAAGRLPADLPAYVASSVARVPAEVIARLQQPPEAKTHAFDTHPSDADRLEAARRVASSGVLSGGEAPATRLFSDFSVLSVEATRLHYERELGLDTAALELLPGDRIAQAHEKRIQGHRALHDVLGDSWSILRPVRLMRPAGHGAVDLAASAVQARAAIGAVDRTAVSAQYREYELQQQRRVDLLTAEALLGAGFATVDASSFGLPTGTKPAITVALAGVDGRLRDLATHLQAFETLAASRLSTGLALAAAHAGRSAVDPVEAAVFVDAINGLADSLTSMSELRTLLATNDVLAGNTASAPDRERFEGNLYSLSGKIEGATRRAHAALAALGLPQRVTDDDAAVAVRRLLGTSVHVGMAGDILEQTAAMYVTLLGYAAQLTCQADETLATSG